MNFSNRTRLFYLELDGINFIATLREICPLYICIAYLCYIDTQECADTRKSLVSRRITEMARRRKEDGRMDSIK